MGKNFIGPILDPTHHTRISRKDPENPDLKRQDGLEDILHKTVHFALGSKKHIGNVKHSKLGPIISNKAYGSLIPEIELLLSFYYYHCEAAGNTSDLFKLCLERVFDDVAYLSGSTIEGMAQAKIDDPAVRQEIRKLKKEIRQYINFRWRPDNVIKDGIRGVLPREMPKAEVYINAGGDDRQRVKHALIYGQGRDDFRKVSLSPIQVFTKLFDRVTVYSALRAFRKLNSSQFCTAQEAYEEAVTFKTDEVFHYLGLRKKGITHNDAREAIGSLKRKELKPYASLRMRYNHTQEDAMGAFSLYGKDRKDYLYFIRHGANPREAIGAIDSGFDACRSLSLDLMRRKRSAR